MILRIRLIIGIDKVEKLVYGRVFLRSLYFEINSIYIVLNQSTLHISKKEVCIETESCRVHHSLLITGKFGIYLQQRTKLIILVKTNFTPISFSCFSIISKINFPDKIEN